MYRLVFIIIIILLLENILDSIKFMNTSFPSVINYVIVVDMLISEVVDDLI